jgi:hypothetical protein
MKGGAGQKETDNDPHLLIALEPPEIVFPIWLR